MSDEPTCPNCGEYINQKDGRLREQCVRMQVLRARVVELEDLIARCNWTLKIPHRAVWQFASATQEHAHLLLALEAALAGKERER